MKKETLKKGTRKATFLLSEDIRLQIERLQARGYAFNLAEAARRGVIHALKEAQARAATS